MALEIRYNNNIKHLITHENTSIHCPYAARWHNHYDLCNGSQV